MTFKPFHFLNDDLPPALAGQVKAAWAPITHMQEGDPSVVLTDEEMAEWHSFKHEARRREYLATRRLLHQIVQEMSIDEEDFELKKDGRGSPYGLSNGTTYPVSMAHTQALVLCGISLKGAVGVDLEPAGREVSEGLRARILNPAEVSLLEDVPTLRIWTIKEALVKLRGHGMRINLRDCVISRREADYFTAKFNDDKRAKICSFEQNKNWMAFAWNL